MDKQTLSLFKPIDQMNSFEQFTVIIGLLAVAAEGWGYVKDFFATLFGKKEAIKH